MFYFARLSVYKFILVDEWDMCTEHWWNDTNRGK
jgi:hypothetical protein